MKKARRSVGTIPTALLVVGLLVLGCQRHGERNRSEYQPRAIPNVPSTRMGGTVIVPTLDTPLAEPGNAVWCATFQVAWNHARDDVIGGALQIANAQTVADRLNGSPVTEAALLPGSYYAAAGRLKDGIVETIHRKMAQQFPGVQPPDFGDAVGFVAYAYLDTKAAFTTPFVDTKKPIQFTDAAGAALDTRSSRSSRASQPGQPFQSVPFDRSHVARCLVENQAAATNLVVKIATHRGRCDAIAATLPDGNGRSHVANTKTPRSREQPHVVRQPRGTS